MILYSVTTITYFLTTALHRIMLILSDVTSVRAPDKIHLNLLQAQGRICNISRNREVIRGLIADVDTVSMRGKLPHPS